ncbi:MAG: hypothetical protein ACRDRL_12890 [Sciscionella sp.]
MGIAVGAEAAARERLLRAGDALAMLSVSRLPRTLTRNTAMEREEQ